MAARPITDETARALRGHYRDVLRRNPGETMFTRDVRAVLTSIAPALAEHPEHLEPLGRLCEPERQILFRVPWVDDDGRTRTNRGFRVEFNSALGPYKGGLRFAPDLHPDVVKFLGFEQVLKNALTGLDMGGGKGGADFDPKGRSEGEVMRFCQSFMTELHRHIGAWTDVPAGDAGVGEREIGWLFGQYKRLVNRYESAALTGKGVDWGGSWLRAEATGYGLVYFVEHMLAESGRDLDGARVVVSGAGNVALHAMDKVVECGGTLVGCSDSQGFVVEQDGIDVEALKRVKAVRGRSVADYAEGRSSAHFSTTGTVFEVECEVALPCATQNELDADTAGRLAKAGCLAVAEGANGPATPEARRVLREAGVAFAPGKASNAGGVAVSGLEMAQNVSRQRWSAEDVDQQLRTIVQDVHRRCRDAGARYFDDSGDYERGANVAGFLRVATAMHALGVV